MDTRMKRALRAAAVVALAFAGFCARAEGGAKKKARGLVPGDRYCGVGNRGGTPTNARDSACKAHDQDYSRLKSKGVNPYRFTSGNKEVIKADWKLANQAREARKSSSIRRDRAKSLVVESVMRAKAASNARHYIRGQVREKVRDTVREQYSRFRNRR